MIHNHTGPPQNNAIDDDDDDDDGSSSSSSSGWFSYISLRAINYACADHNNLYQL